MRHIARRPRVSLSVPGLWLVWMPLPESRAAGEGSKGGAQTPGQVIPQAKDEDVSKLWICYPLGVRENHQRA
jgi:hypothetical protein